MNESDVTWKFATGPLSHELVAGVELDHEESDLIRYDNQLSSIPATPLLAPDPFEAFPGHQTSVKQRPDTVADTIGAYLVDTITFAQHWSLVAALRQDRFAASYDEPVSHSHFKHTDWVLTPRAALVYKPDDLSSYYISFGTSYDPSAENLSLSSRNADLGPEKDRTFELGAKRMLLGGMLSVTGAIFDTEMTNARIADPLNPGLQALAGTLTVRGAELNAVGYLTDHWEINAGYTYLDASSKGLFGTDVTGPVPNTARNQANLWTTYDFDDGLKLGAGANYLGRRAAFKSASGVAHIPGYVTIDAMASYPVSDNVTLQVNGYNLFDKHYYANVYYSSASENHAVPGAGRTLTLTALVNF
jgi:catecholate siderophore receptor